VESVLASTNGGLVVDRYYALENSANPLIAPTETQSDLQVNGLYANVNLGFRDILYLDLAARRDQSSSLRKGNNVYYYPSTAISFVFSELMQNQQWLNNGKFRVNYAEVGNTAPAQSLRDVYDKPAAFGATTLFSVQSTKFDPELKPERTKSFETGLEMSFIQDRVGFDFTYYKTNTVDQIVPAPISRATGYDAKFINAGNVQNQGYELSLYGSPIVHDEFSWRVNLNWTRNRSKVLSLAENIDNLQLGSFQNGISLNAALGQPYGVLRGTDFVYNENGDRLVDESGYYQISTESNKIIGNINPNWIAGINNTFKYKGFTFRFLVDTRRGGSVYSLDLAYGLSGGLYPETAGLNKNGKPIRSDMAEGGGWIYPGVKADGTPNDIVVDASAANGYGTFGTDYSPARAFIYDATYVKLREVVFGYTIPASITSRLGPVKGIDISLVGRNLWIIYKNLPYADPEDSMGSGNLASGFQTGAYPNVRNMGFNIRVSL
jgi:outer membrane receptor protein involved in Fe transport